MQSMPSIASCMDLNFKRLQLQCGSQSKPFGSLRWNSQVEGINRGRSRGMWGMHPLPSAIFHNALDKYEFAVILNLFIKICLSRLKQA